MISSPGTDIDGSGSVATPCECAMPLCIARQAVNCAETHLVHEASKLNLPLAKGNASKKSAAHTLAGEIDTLTTLDEISIILNGDHVHLPLWFLQLG